MLSQLTHDIIKPVQAPLIDEKVSKIIIPDQYLRFRRGVEVLMVILSSPVMIVIGMLVALLIALGSKGNVFYVQWRPGKNGRLFRMIKFRTMYVHASADRLAQENDLRITGIGKWLRKFRIDEIPQLWNVLKGDMSIIGPRPVPYTFYKIYLQEVPGYNLRHTIRPGITGLAQVVQGYTRTIDEERIKLTYDLHYINNISIKMDLSILVRTVSNVIRGKK